MATLRESLQKIKNDYNSTYFAEAEVMSAHTSFRVGGPADFYVRPSTIDALTCALDAAREQQTDLCALGGGANLLVGDKGIRGLVIDTSSLCSFRAEGPTSIYVEAGSSVDSACEFALERSLAGLGFMYGMPGSVGGALFMNARCYDREIADLVLRIDYLECDSSGAWQKRSRLYTQSEWGYKRSPFTTREGDKTRFVILGALLGLRKGDPETIRAEMVARKADREAKGHYRFPSAGSVFKNDRAFGAPTGKILDELGLRGRTRGGAMVAEYHANIVVNVGGATAADIRALIEELQSIALERRGIKLEREVIYLGEF